MTICWICSRHLAPSKGREMRLVEDMAVLRTWVCYECRPVEDEGEDRMSHYMLTADSIFVEESDARLDYGRSWESEETDKECRKYAQELSDDKWTYEYRDVIVIRSIIRYKTEYKVKYIQKGEKIPKNLIKIVGVLQFIRDAIDIDTMHDDPLPPHEPDGYWSGYRVDDMWVREGTKSSDYAEDDDIPAMA